MSWVFLPCSQYSKPVLFLLCSRLKPPLDEASFRQLPKVKLFTLMSPMLKPHIILDKMGHFIDDTVGANYQKMLLEKFFF